MPEISAADIQRAVQTSFPLTFTIEGPVHESFSSLDNIVETCLVELGQEKIREALSYCVKELILNAEKANAKRIYFEEHGLTILNKKDYEKGMQGFRAALSENLDHFLEKLREKRAAIDVVFHYVENVLTVSVKNTGELSPGEHERIKDRFKRARTSRSFSDALETSLDHSEGAGLGIVMVLQFLKSIGLDDEALSVRNEGGMTVSSIVIPVLEVGLDQIRALARELVRHVGSLPQFPETVVALLRLTDDPNASVAEISKYISRDPALTAELLKHVNSAYYGLPSRVNGIPHAVKMIGLRSLHHLLYSFGFHLILDQHHPRMKSLWDRSLRTAFYAFLLARDKKRRPDILDDVYVTGILHDLGFIVVSTLKPSTQEKMRKFCMEKNIASSVLERFSFGMNHAEVGALIAEKWNFPNQLVEGIRYHTDPLHASQDSRDAVFCVYLGNAVCDFEERLVSYRQIEGEVLADFGLRTEAEFLDMTSNLKKSFEKNLASLSPSGA
jgi:HD-like signal output (HDOD) protein